MFHSFWGLGPQTHVLAYVLTCIVFWIRLCRSTRFLGRSPSRQTFSWIL